MNQIIEELAEQAEQYALDKANESNDEEDYEYTFDDDFRQKFAELIIRKCADIATREQASNPQVKVNQCILTEFGL